MTNTQRRAQRTRKVHSVKVVVNSLNGGSVYLYRDNGYDCFKVIYHDDYKTAERFGQGLADFFNVPCEVIKPSSTQP